MPINNAATRWLARRVHAWAVGTTICRDPDFLVGGASDPYLRRWWLIPRNRWMNIYLHEFLRDDEDRACHCHPWVSLSLSLNQSLDEIWLDRRYGFCIERRRSIDAGTVVLRRAKFAHRMVVPEPRVLTLFITGPVVREWGFWCDRERFVPWRQFVDDRDSGKVGRGCD
jgi:hypothetical protein